MIGNLLDNIIKAKTDILRSRMKQTSLDAIRAMASMQSRPLPFLTTVGLHTTLIGQVRYELPKTGDLSTRYDPVSTAKSYIAAGVDAVSIFTDAVIEYNGVIDMTLVNEALKTQQIPLITQDYILHEYHILEMRAAGASVILLTAGILSSDKLRQLTSTVHRNRMTAVVDVYDHDQLQDALTWSPQVIGIGGQNPFYFHLDLERAQYLRPHIPNGQRVMITRVLHTLDEVKHAAKLRPDAVILSNQLVLGGAIDEIRAIFQHAPH